MNFEESFTKNNIPSEKSNLEKRPVNKNESFDSQSLLIGKKNKK
jgi:hypothetical protein